MNNSIYGKTVENVQKRQDIRFVTKRKQALKLIVKMNFKKETIFSKNLAAIHMNKLEILYNKPIFVGFTILELSKWVMYDFVYNYIKPKWKENVTICGTDTDSLFLEIKTDDFYEDIKPDINKWFDTSDFPKDNRFGYPLVNKKKLGTFTIETCDNIVKEFVGLRAKMYAIDVENLELKNAQKGIPRHKKVQSIDEFKNVLFNNYKHSFDFNRIGSKKLDVFNIKQEKVGLVNFDDKRYVLDGINTLAFGHYKIKKE